MGRGWCIIWGVIVAVAVVAVVGSPPGIVAGLAFGALTTRLLWPRSQA